MINISGSSSYIMSSVQVNSFRSDSNAYSNMDLKTVLNNCKSSAQYTKISDLREDNPYKIVKFERVNTQYGITVMVTLEGQLGDESYLRVYLPKRFSDMLKDNTIENYNAGVGDLIHLVKRSATTSGSSATPLEFV